MKYAYLVIDRNAKKLRGEMSAVSESHARQLLNTKFAKIVELGLAPDQQPSSQDEKPSNRLRLVQGFAVASLPILALGFWISRGAKELPGQVAATPPPKLHRTVKISGVLPSQPVDTVHLVCLGATIQLDKPAVELGQPGQPFSWEVEVSSTDVDLRVELGRGGQRWLLGSFDSSQQQAVNFASVEVPPVAVAGGPPKPLTGPIAAQGRRLSRQERNQRLEDRRKHYQELVQAHYPQNRRRR